VRERTGRRHQSNLVAAAPARAHLECAQAPYALRYPSRLLMPRDSSFSSTTFAHCSECSRRRNSASAAATVVLPTQGRPVTTTRGISLQEHERTAKASRIQEKNTPRDQWRTCRERSAAGLCDQNRILRLKPPDRSLWFDVAATRASVQGRGRERGPKGAHTCGFASRWRDPQRQAFAAGQAREHRGT